MKSAACWPVTALCRHTRSFFSVLTGNDWEAEAQFNVGFLYSQGNGGPQDDVEAYKWFTLAAATYTEKQFRDGAVQARDRVAARMTPALIAEAQKLAREWTKQ